MKKIMVFDVPATTGGALTILNQYYEQAKIEKNIEWIFVVSTPELIETDNITVVRYPWVKKSWFHRLYFDKFIAHKVVEEHQPDEILSLQNVIISGVDVKQTLYLHQSLPFAEKKFKIYENFKFWLYQNIISKMIYQSIKDADKVIVQTEWIKEAAIKKTGANEDKFILRTPEIDMEIKQYYHPDNNPNNRFFYPAGAMEYKNHKVIVEASRLLKKQGKNNYEIIFTLSGNENKHVSNLYQIIASEKLPIKFIGEIPIEKVYQYYEKSILIFPSYIETFGLPMLEARMHKTPVIAADTNFAREVLRDYKSAVFFQSDDSIELSHVLKNKKTEV